MAFTQIQVQVPSPRAGGVAGGAARPPLHGRGGRRPAAARAVPEEAHGDRGRGSPRQGQVGEDVP